MKIGIISTVSGGYSWAGSEEMWRIIAESALSVGYSVRVSIVTSMANSAELQQAKSKGALVLARPEFNGFSRRLAQRGLYTRFSEFRGDQASLICLSMGAVADCIWMPDLLRCYWQSPVPWVIIVQSNSDHIISGEEQRKILRQFYTKAKKVIFVSNQNLRLAERQLAMRLTNAVVLPNPIREELDTPLAWPEPRDGIWRFAEVARFDISQKRQDHLLEALSLPQWSRRPWKLSFYGSGPDEQHIRALVKHFGLESRVEFPGHVRSLRDIWCNNHLHILPTAYEGMPLALIESMFCGRPALVTRAGGSTELVQDTIEGFISPGMHPEIISETLEHAWKMRESWQEMGQNAFKRAKQIIPKDLATQILTLMEDAVTK